MVTLLMVLLLLLKSCSTICKFFRYGESRFNISFLESSISNDDVLYFLEGKLTKTSE